MRMWRKSVLSVMRMRREGVVSVMRMWREGVLDRCDIVVLISVCSEEVPRWDFRAEIIRVGITRKTLKRCVNRR